MTGGRLDLEQAVVSLLSVSIVVVRENLSVRVSGGCLGECACMCIDRGC